MTRDLNERTSGFKTALRKHEQSEFFTQNNLGILQFVKLKCRLIAEVNQTNQGAQYKACILFL